MKKVLVLLALALSFQSYGQQMQITCDTVYTVTCDTTYSDTLAAVKTVATGSSSILLWQGLETTAFGIPIIKRAWGGYGIMDIFYRVDTAVTAKNPKQIIVYVGDNDFDRTDLTDSAIYARYVKLVDKIVLQNPTARALFISVKPNPVKPQLNSRIVAFNNKLELYLQNKPTTRFVNIYPLMLNSNGTINLSLYQPQPNVHLSGTGYGTWEYEVRQHML